MLLDEYETLHNEQLSMDDPALLIEPFLRYAFVSVQVCPHTVQYNIDLTEYFVIYRRNTYVVGREGFEPSKAQGQLIYSQPRLTTSLPTHVL